MTPEKAKEWIEALEGPYADKKGEGYLCNEYGEMCCLGVLADMNGDWDAIQPDSGPKEINNLNEFPSDAFLQKHGIEVGDRIGDDGRGAHAWRLANINDNSPNFAPVIAEIRRMFIEGKGV